MVTWVVPNKDYKKFTARLKRVYGAGSLTTYPP